MEQGRGSRHIAEQETAGSAYSDAYYREAPDEKRAVYGYNPAQCYAHVSAPEQPAGKKRTGVWESAALLFALLLIAASGLALGSVLLSRNADAGSEELQAGDRGLYAELELGSEQEQEQAIGINRSEADTLQELTATEIYAAACEFTVGVTVPGYTFNIFGQAGVDAVTGTGIVLSEDGYILTNFHVIESAYGRGAPIRILTYDGHEYDAEVVGVENDSDLALLKVEAEGLTAAVVGDSDDICVGQTIYTVGNPLGELTYTMTGGIVSALGRRITTDETVIVNMFQVDAAVNSGNSGGPVFNTCGQVIGVVTAKYTQDGMEGLGFAIPINDAVKIACDLAEKGYVTGKAYLGMSFANVSPIVARYYDMVQGVYICAVEEGSCSEAAGLAQGDIILAIDGREVRTASDLAKIVREYRAGDSAELTVWRSHEMITVTVIFDEELPAERVEEQENPDVHPSTEMNTLES